MEDRTTHEVNYSIQSFTMQNSTIPTARFPNAAVAIGEPQFLSGVLRTKCHSELGAGRWFHNIHSIARSQPCSL